jgi:hypothetical protein
MALAAFAITVTYARNHKDTETTKGRPKCAHIEISLIAPRRPLGLCVFVVREVRYQVLLMRISNAKPPF